MSNSIHLHSCAGCGGKSWGDDGRCEYCGGNVKKVVESILPSAREKSGGINDHFPIHVNSIMGFVIKNPCTFINIKIS